MENKIPTIAEFIELVKQKKINLCHDFNFYGNTIEDIIPDYVDFLESIGKELGLDSDISHLYDIVDGVAWFGGYLIVFDDNNTPITIMCEYEQKNHGVIGDVVACPGRDGLSLYNKKTNEYKRIIY